MRLHENQVAQHSGGLDDTRKFDFKISMNAKAFAVTIDKLYMDKVKASVREYSCNALDANPPGVPIQVHMPSLYEPYWAVSDEGSGLAPEQMEDIFCVLFKSTKDERDDQIGALGLGCKSAFAYTDQFTVESRHAGKSTTYTATRAGGIPQMIPLVERDLEDGEKTGVTITIPVKTTDFHLWEQAARQVYAYFTVKPKFTHKPIQIEVREKPVMQDKFWRYYPVVNRYGAHASTVFPDRAVAIMGQIAYPIDLATMSPHLTPSERTLLEVPLEIDVKMGEVDIQPSREGLSYDKATIATLQARLQIIAKDLADKFLDPFRKTYKTAWEKAVNYNRAYEGVDHRLRGTITSELQRLVPNGGRLLLDAEKAIGPNAKYFEAWVSGNKKLTDKWRPVANVMPDGNGPNKNKRMVSLPVSLDTFIVIVDQIPRYIDKLNHFYNGKNIIAILPDPNVPFDPKEWGDVPMTQVVKISDLVLPPTVLTALRTRSAPRKVLGFTAGGWVGDEVSHTFEDGGVFVRREQRILVGPDKKPNYILNDAVLRNFFRLKVLDHTKTFAVNKTYWDSLDPDDGWEDAWDVIKRTLETNSWVLDALTMEARDELIMSQSKGKDSGLFHIAMNLPDGKTYGPSIEALRTVVKPFLTPISHKNLEVAIGKWVLDVAKELKITLPAKPQASSLVTAAITKVKADYPMLDIFSKNVYQGTMNDLLSGKSSESNQFFDYLK